MSHETDKQTSQACALSTALYGEIQRRHDLKREEERPLREFVDLICRTALWESTSEEQHREAFNAAVCRRWHLPEPNRGEYYFQVYEE